MTIITYTKLFTRGLLPGFSTRDRIRFEDRCRATFWLNSARQSSTAGRVDYRITRVRMRQVGCRPSARA